ncbi:MAG TPA: universal stress protein [Planctomycetota bacterium]|nr:universal stress protein [Planctomycetota bacterium]
MSRIEPTHLLVPIDLSEASRAGLRVAADLARRFGARITALHVESATAGLAEVLASTGELGDAEAVAGRHLEGVRDRVARFVDRTRGSGSSATPVVIEALFVAEAIVQFAKEREADWICMSAAGHQGWRHLFLGSVTAEVVRRSTVPVLTYRGRGKDASEFVYDDFRRVLVAVDLGDESRQLVDLGRSLAGPTGELTLLHVIDVAPEYGLYGVPLVIPAENLDAAKEWTETALERLAKGVDEKVRQPLKVLAGRPAERILATETEIAPDVTIIGTHGRHGLDRLMLGSVAERVVQRATGPVLVVPTRKK